MVRRDTKEKMICWRASQDDLRVIKTLKQKTGVQATGEIVRLALRAMLKEHHEKPLASPKRPRQ